MKIKEQTRKLATGCSKHCFEVADKLTKSAQNTALRLQIELKVSNHTYGKATLTRFEEIFEEYKGVPR
ncbi:hypothetical protein [Streptococcus pneumoniae]|uniref:hypothetical protein n=1 Tax=Streptococcus pneumoniae TaxID=1313 RepID=UPI00099B66D3|nr:hypothetical protein [Streptococcus pneumoniae]